MVMVTSIVTEAANPVTPKALIVEILAPTVDSVVIEAASPLTSKALLVGILALKVDSSYRGNHRYRMSLLP